MSLPELPEPVQIDKHLPTGIVIRGYTAEQMRSYALSCVEAERERCAKICEQYALRHNDIRRAALERFAEILRAQGKTE